MSSFGLLQRCQVKRSASLCDQAEVAMRVVGGFRSCQEIPWGFGRFRKPALCMSNLRIFTSEEQFERQLADTGVERRRDAAEGAVGNGSIRIAEVSVIQYVEVFRPELELD